MSWFQFVERAFKSIVPTANRATGGSWIETVPRMAVSKQLLGGVMPVATGTATSAWAGWGLLVELLAAGANTTECWIEGLLVLDLLTEAGAAETGTVDIGITMEAGAAAPTTAQLEAQVSAYLICGAAGGPYAKYIPLDPPIYIPPDIRIACALNSISASKRIGGTAGTYTEPKCRVRLQLSRAK